jgi:hypothetical protein
VPDGETLQAADKIARLFEDHADLPIDAGQLTYDISASC